jgi:hypothetical protein
MGADRDIGQREPVTQHDGVGDDAGDRDDAAFVCTLGVGRIVWGGSFRQAMTQTWLVRTDTYVV